MADTTATGLPYPELVDENNPPADFLELATQLDLVTIPAFASTGARDTALSAAVTGQPARVGSQPYIKHSDRWGRILTDRSGTPMVPLGTNPDVDLVSVANATRFSIGSITPQSAGLALFVEAEVVLTQVGGGGTAADIQVSIEYNAGSWVAMDNAVAGAGIAPATAARQVTIPVRGIIPAPASARNPSVGVSVWRLNGNTKRVSHIRAWVTPINIVTGF